jgi:putative ABC transport system permease protein
VLLLFIGSLTLGIGGVGLTNIMLVSVEERVREIGLRRALGAKKWHIKLQFFLEAFLLTALGGVIGMIISYLISAVTPKLPLLGAMMGDSSGRGDIQLQI